MPRVRPTCLRRSPGRRPGQADRGDDRGDDRGAVAVEFALLFPLLFLLLFGIIRLGWGLWEHQAAQSTAREAARLASFGVSDKAAFARQVVCLGEHDGLSSTRPTELDLGYFKDLTEFTGPTQQTAETNATVNGYLYLTLTYRSAMAGLPFTAFTINGGGTVTVHAMTRIEQTTGTQVPAFVQSLDGVTC
jgi:hypothetical protein